MINRIEFDDRGRLDEVVTDGGGHLEHISGRRWFLALHRADGSKFCVWFEGKIDMTEDRPARDRMTDDGNA